MSGPKADPRFPADASIHANGSDLRANDTLFADAAPSSREAAEHVDAENPAAPAKLVDDLYVETISARDFDARGITSWRKPAKLVDELLYVDGPIIASHRDIAGESLLRANAAGQIDQPEEPSVAIAAADGIEETRGETPRPDPTFTVALAALPADADAAPAEETRNPRPAEADTPVLARAPTVPDADAKALPKLQSDLVPYDVFTRNTLFETRPLGEFNRLGAPTTAVADRGIDSSDVKWRRQARITGVRMRMLNGPEIAGDTDYFSSDYERGTRFHLGGIMPVNSRWELAALSRTGAFQLRETGERAGVEAVTLRIGANPSVSFRPWLSITPYTGLWQSDALGVGVAAGAQKSFGGLSFTGRAFAFEPWDEGYDTALHDGRRHGFEFTTSIQVDRRLTINAAAGYEWLELGPHAPNGRENAGRRFNWMLRADWIALKRDGAYMGYGFRDPSLWSEQLVPCDFGFFAQVGGERYFQPENFTTINPTRRSMSERVGFFLNQAISPHIGVNVEGYVGQDPYREIRRGDLYGLTARLNVVVNERFRMWAGWGHESSSTSLESGSGPTRYLSFGFNVNF